MFQAVEMTLVLLSARTGGLVESMLLLRSPHILTSGRVESVGFVVLAKSNDSELCVG